MGKYQPKTALTDAKALVKVFGAAAGKAARQSHLRNPDRPR